MLYRAVDEIGLHYGEYDPRMLICFCHSSLFKQVKKCIKYINEYQNNAQIKQLITIDFIINMDYIPPHVDINTPKIAQDNLTPDLTRICPICFEKWTGIGAQLILHILQKHTDDLINQQDKYQGDDSELVNNTDFNEYIFTLIDNDNETTKSTPELNELVKIFIEYEKIFVLTIQKFPDEFKNRGFNVTVNYIGPYLNKVECMKFTCMLQYDLNNKKCLSSLSDIVGETAQFIIDDDFMELKQPISHWPMIIKVQINVPKKFQELIDAMKSRLTCFRCNAMMVPPIRHCRFGHIICKFCRQNIPCRPICPNCYKNSIKFNEENNSLHDIHPAMRLKTQHNYKAELVSEVMGTGDAFQKMTLNVDSDVKELRSNIGNLRLLEEEALQVAYCCDGEKCKIWISCLDLEEHKKDCH